MLPHPIVLWYASMSASQTAYKMALMPKEQIKTMQDRYDKYDIENHKLLYDMAYVYQYQLKDKKNTERCLEA